MLRPVMIGSALLNGGATSAGGLHGRRNRPQSKLIRERRVSARVFVVFQSKYVFVISP